MLSELYIQNFTAFENAKFKFSSGLNVIIGANGAGKSHVLKLAYSVAKTSFNQQDAHKQSKAAWQKNIAEDLLKVFRPESLGRLARRQKGVITSSVGVKFEQIREANFSFNFSTKANTEVKLDNDVPTQFAPSLPIFIPPKELLSLFPGFLSLYNTRELNIDATYPDLCLLLDAPLLKGPRLNEIKDVVSQLENMAGGEVKKENGKFYIYQEGGGRIEIDLVAEGLRKLAMLAYLLKNGSLNDATVLFWDEPEANLNPVLIKKLAEMLMTLSAYKFQIIIATHSLFLLKELHILSKENIENKVRYFGMALNDKHASDIVMTDNLEALPHIASLEAEMEQTDRFSEVLNSDNAYNN